MFSLLKNERSPHVLVGKVLEMLIAIMPEPGKYTCIYWTLNCHFTNMDTFFISIHYGMGFSFLS